MPIFVRLQNSFKSRTRSKFEAKNVHQVVSRSILCFLCSSILYHPLLDFKFAYLRLIFTHYSPCCVSLCANEQIDCRINPKFTLRLIRFRTYAFTDLLKYTIDFFRFNSHLGKPHCHPPNRKSSPCAFFVVCVSLCKNDP